MPFYGYDPRQYVQSDKYGIARGSAVLGKAFAEFPEAERRQEKHEIDMGLIEKGIKEAEQDTTKMDKTWQAFKNKYVELTTPLVESGQMSQEEQEANINRLSQPTYADQKNVRGYLGGLGRDYIEIVNDAKKRTRQAQLTGGVTKAREGVRAPRPAGAIELGETTQVQVPPTQPMGQPPTGAPPETFEETTITERPLEYYQAQPAATTKEQISMAPQVTELAPTTEELRGVPAFETAPTGLQVEKEKRLGEKEKRLQERTSYQDAMMSYRWATLNYKKTKDVKTLRLAEDKVKKAFVPYKARLKTDIMKINSEIATLKKGEQDFEGNVEVDWEAIDAKQQEILLKEGELTDLDAQQKMIGAIPGETRKFSPTTGKETERTGGFREKAIGGGGAISRPAGTTSKMEQSIRDTLAGRGVAQETIESYIADKKSKGQL